MFTGVGKSNFLDWIRLQPACRQQLELLHVVHFTSSVCASSRKQKLSGMKLQTFDRPVVVLQLMQKLACCDVPDLASIVIRSGSNPLAIRTELNAVYFIGVVFISVDAALSPDVPHASLVIV